MGSAMGQRATRPRKIKPSKVGRLFLNMLKMKCDRHNISKILFSSHIQLGQQRCNHDNDMISFQ